MKFESYRVNVETSAKSIFKCRVRDLNSVEIYANGAMYIGIGGVSSTSGIPLAINESRNITHLDFRKDLKEVQDSFVEIYGVATVATTAQIFGWFR